MAYRQKRPSTKKNENGALNGALGRELKRIAIRLGFAIVATFILMAVLKNSLENFFAGVSKNSQNTMSQIKENQKRMTEKPRALLEAQSELESLGCTPMPGASLRAYPPGKYYGADGPLAIALFAMCPRDEGKALIGYQDKDGRVYLSYPMFKTVSILKLEGESVLVKATPRGETMVREFRFVTAEGKLLPLMN